jgi:ABC-2 type transport system permease protein
VIRVELSLLVRRPRTWISLAILVALPLTAAIFLAATHLGPQADNTSALGLLSQVQHNGTFLAAAALAVDLVPLLPLCVLVVAGDAIAGEASGGTLRYLLTRPVSRSRLLSAKLVSIVTYVIAAVIAIALSGYLSGILLFPSSGSITSLSGGEPLTPSQTTIRVVLTVFYVGISMLGVAAFALLLSTIVENPLAATIGGFAALVTSTTLDALDAAGEAQPYLPTHYWLSFVDFFRNPILWRDIERGLLLQLVYVAVMLGLAWAYFTTKDIKS